MAWTLEIGGVEMELAAWGLSAESVQLQRNSTAADVLTVRKAASDCLAALDFAYDAITVFRRDRNGSGTAWTGGSVYFVGRATVPQRSGQGTAESITYRFHGPWFDLQRQIYHQSWKFYTGDPENLGTYNTCEVFLGRKLDGTVMNSGQQITDALNWAISCGVQLQVGTIDPVVNIFYVNARSVTCAEVIKTMLRNTPDAVCWFDYTTLDGGNPKPTFHCRQLANLPAVTVTLGVEKFRGLELTPRYDLQVPSVVIHFKQVNTVDGEAYVNWTKQTAPVGADGKARGGEVHVIELEGFSRTSVHGSLTTTPINAQSGTEAARIAWWKQHEKVLESGNIKPSTLHVTSATAVDEDGNAVNLANYPNELTEGQIAEWMNFNAKTITIKATVSYELYADTAHTAALKLQTVKNREVSVRITATNGVTGDYNALASFTEGESEPAGLANAYYNAMQVLQYDGTIDLVATELPTTQLIGKKLTLAGSALSITSQLIQSVTEQPHFGRYSITIGPGSRLGIQDLVERHNATRFRRIYNMPSTQSTGKAGGGGSVKLGKNTARENTTGGLGEREVTAQTYDDGTNRTLVTHDAQNKKFTMRVVDRTTGTQKANLPSVELNLGDMPSLPDGQTAKVVKLQAFTDAQGQTQYVFATAPVSGGSAPTWLA